MPHGVPSWLDPGFLVTVVFLLLSPWLSVRQFTGGQLCQNQNPEFLFSRNFLQAEEVSYKPSEELKLDYDTETPFNVFPDSLQQLMTILPFLYAVRFVIATLVFKTKFYNIYMVIFIFAVLHSLRDLNSLTRD